MPDPVLVKKYSSRRLYDVAGGKFITLDELDRLIRRGRNIQAVDSDGHDITRGVLLQILTEREAHGEPLLSTNTLHEMVRLYGHIMQGPFGRYLEDSMAVLRQQRELWQSAIPDEFRGMTADTISRLMDLQLSLWKQSQDALLDVFGMSPYHAKDKSPHRPEHPSESDD